MFTTLRAKLAVMLFGLLGLLGVFHTVWVIRTSRFYLQEVNQKLDRDLAKHLVEERVVTANGLINKQAASDTFRTLMLINRNIELYLLDRDGRILAFSALPGSVKRTSVRVEPIRQFLARDPFPIFGDDPKNPQGQKVFSVADVSLSPTGHTVPGAEGYLYVVLLGEDYVSPFALFSSSRSLRSSAWALGVSVGIALVASLLIVRMLTQRLSGLGLDMQEFRGRVLDHMPPSQVRGVAGVGDEIDQLTIAFQDMAQTIHAQLERLKENDRLRRELMANVSHDLRTPLQSLHAYLETLLRKEHSLSGGERQQYLETAVKHCTSLGILISQLFELAKLESREIQPEREPFSMCELAQDIAQRFELLAREHGLRLQTVLGRHVPQAVGDIALVERVLVNLIENAMRHTPAGGTIAVDCRASGSKVVTSVTDTGSGIAAADVPHIFERFYRPPEETHPRTDGAGLGLAICQQILQLQGSSLRVETPGHGGSMFSFDLPQVEPSRASGDQLQT